MRMLVTSLAALLLSSQAHATPRVLTSVVPVHAIVSVVMGDTGTPELLLSGQLSEHRATYTPSQIKALGEADITFIVGHGLEAKLARMSGTEAVNGKVFIELAEAQGVRTLPIREGGAWEGHDHEHHDDHAEGHARKHAEGVLAFDPHVWLDPENAKAMANAVSRALGEVDPANSAAYDANARAFASSIDALSAEIAGKLADVKDKPYIVFHDAYQYFEARFGLNAVGSISDFSAKAPSAARLSEIRRKISATGARCVFREPQYDDRTVNVVIEGTGARPGILDPLGAALEPGPAAYRALLENLAAALGECLAG